MSIMHLCKFFYFKIKYFGKGCQMSQMIILNFKNSYKFISLDLEHYFKSYKRKTEKEKEKNKPTRVRPTQPGRPNKKHPRGPSQPIGLTGQAAYDQVGRSRFFLNNTRK